jgi:flagellar hook protein FlgE
MVSAISTALSALQADSAAIDVTGNNLANLNTTGYKTVEVEFEDLMSQSLGVGSSTGQLGLGVGQIETNTVYSQGTLTTTTGLMDAAISGNGFFVVQDPSSGQQLYTRDGSFQLDSNGNLITSTGQYVQGWTATNGAVDTNGAIGNITIPTGTVSGAKATTTMDVVANLDSAATVGAANGTFSTPIQVYDSLGESHTLTVTFTKTAANSWSYSVGIPSADLSSGGTTALATGTLTFDSSGNLTSPAPPTTSNGVTTPSTPVSIAISGFADGAADQTISWNLFSDNGAGTQELTQYAQTSAESSATQDGYAAGQVTQVALGNGGTIMATYSNGQTVMVGQLAEAAIGNPTTLESVGDNNLAITAQTAAPVIGAADTGDRGQIEAGELESSTADMATEFTNLLQYQRSYEAASKVITTSDELTQETLGLIK